MTLWDAVGKGKYLQRGSLVSREGGGAENEVWQSRSSRISQRALAVHETSAETSLRLLRGTKIKSTNSRQAR